MSIVVRSNEKPQMTPPTVESSAPDANGNNHVGQTQEQPSTLSALEGEPPSEQNEASDSETEGEKVETKPEEETEGQEKDPGKKKGGFQRRIDKLNQQKAQAQQELEYWKQMALKSAGGSKNDSNSNQTVEPTQNSDQKPNPDKFETHAEYVEALTDWKTEQKLKEREDKYARERIAETQSKLVATYKERMEAFTQKTPDFQDVLEEVNHVHLSPTLRDIILTSDNGPQIAYELAKNPDEYERIAKLSPTACAREIGKFEARLTPSSSSKVSTDGSKKITHAPPPIAPVGTGGKGSVPKSIFDQNLSQKEYEALRREQMKKRRQA